RAASLVALAACAGFVGCAGKSHARSAENGNGEAASIAGPAAVVPGKTARFTASGFRPGAVELVLAPADKTACCAVRIQPAFTVASDGRAVMKFVLPATY